MNWGGIILGLGFWTFLSVAAVAGMITEYKKRQMHLEPLRLAIERGQQLDPAIIERLMAREHHETEVNPLYLRIGGIICVAAGVGLGGLGWFVAQVLPPAFYPIIGTGVLAICIGIGLLVATTAVERYQTTHAPRGPAA